MLIQRYILKELVITFLALLVVIAAVIFVGSGFQIYRHFEGLGTKMVLRVAPYIIILTLPYAILISLTSAITLVYGRLSEDNEITAIRISGMNMNKIIAPTILVCLVASCLCFYLNEYLVPQKRHLQRTILKSSVIELLRSPPPSKYDLSLRNYHISYESFRNGKLHNMTLSVLDKNGKLESQYFAKEALIKIEKWKNPYVVLIDCNVIKFKNSKEVDHAKFGELPLTLDIGDISNKTKRFYDMSRQELIGILEKQDISEKDKSTILTELNIRYAMSLAPLFLGILVIPIGIFVRKGNKLAGLGISLPTLVLYFVLSVCFEGLGKEGVISPFLAGWTPLIIIATISCFLYFFLYKK